MNHYHICMAWVAHNLGADHVYVTAGRRRSHGETICIPAKASARGSRIRYDGAEIYSNWANDVTHKRLVRVPKADGVEQ